MAMIITRRMPKSVQFALCVSVGFLGGVSLLLDIPPKWKAALIMAMGVAVLLLVVNNSKRVLLFALMFTAPFYIGKDFLYRTGYFGLVDAVGLYLTDVLVVALLMLRLGQMAVERRTKLRPFLATTVPALAWLVASGLSLINAREVYVAAIQMIVMSKLILLYLVVANNIEDEKDVKWLVSGLFLGVSFQALLGLYQGITGHPLGLSFLGEGPLMQQELGSRVTHRVRGTMGHPNSYAMYLSATLPFALALLFSEIRGLYKALAGIVLCAGAMGLVFSLSRSGWTSFVVILIVILMLAIRRRRLNPSIALPVSGVILALLLTLPLSQWGLIGARLTSDDHGAARSRITLAKGSLAVIQDYPLLGVGLNNYSLLIPHYDPITFREWQRPGIVHNAFLLITAETGFIGLVAFLWFLASVSIQAWRLVSQASNDTLWTVGVGILSAYISLSIHSMSDYALISDLRLLTLMWLLAGIAAGSAGTLDLEGLRETRA